MIKYLDYTPQMIKDIIKGKDVLAKAQLIIESDVADAKGEQALLTGKQTDTIIDTISYQDKGKLGKYLELWQPLKQQRFAWALILNNIKGSVASLYIACTQWELAEDDVKRYNAVMKVLNSPDSYHIKLDKISKEELIKNVSFTERYPNFTFDRNEDGSLSLNLNSVYKYLERSGNMKAINYLLTEVKTILYIMDEYEKKYPIIRDLIPSDIEEMLKQMLEDICPFKKFSRRHWLTLKAEKKYREAKAYEPYAIFPDLTEVKLNKGMIQRAKIVFGI